MTTALFGNMVEFAYETMDGDMELEVTIVARVEFGPVAEDDYEITEIRVTASEVVPEEDWPRIGLDEALLHDLILTAATNPPAPADSPGTFLFWLTHKTRRGNSGALIAADISKGEWKGTPVASLWLLAIDCIRHPAKEDDDTRVLVAAWREFERASWGGLG